MGNENQLLEQKELRESVIGRIEVLDKVGDLLMLGNTEYATTSQVATYYGVGLEAIKAIRFEHLEELRCNGLKTVMGKELKGILASCGISYTNHKGYFIADGQKFANGKNTLFSKRSILRVGLLLRDSEVAECIKKELGIPKNSNLFSRKEIKCKKELDNIVHEVRYELKNNIHALPTTELYTKITKAIDNLTHYKTQYYVCNNKYRIDFYFPLLNLAIEYDELYHKSQKEEDIIREYEIKRELYIDKHYNDVTNGDLREYEFDTKYDLYDFEYKNSLLEHNYDLTRFIRVYENKELDSLFKIATALTSLVSEIIHSRGMSCKYDDLLELSL